MSVLIDVRNASLSVPVKIGKQRLLKTDAFNLVRQLYFSDSSWKQAHLLKNINLKVESGDRIAIVGPNGAGKSTLLYMMGKNYYPTSGEVDHFGDVQPIYDLKVGFSPTASGMENIYLRGLLMGMKLADIGDKLDEIIEFSELEDHISKPLSTYSSGMKMRLAFAITMCISPDVLLMDEWFNVGDKNFRAKAGDKMRSFIQGAKALVIVSHSETVIKNFCNKEIVIKYGEIVSTREIDPNTYKFEY